MYPENPSVLARQICENLQTPDRLNDHAWGRSLLVEAAMTADTQEGAQSRGAALATEALKLFREMMPSLPPKRGKRLDTRWGEFGVLAAQYFAPRVFGIHTPASLRDAWAGIDEAILLFVYGKPASDLTPELVERYKLVGDEPNVTPKSTISDWNRKGLERFTGLFLESERHLSLSLGRPSPVLADTEPGSTELETTPASTQTKPDPLSSQKQKNNKPRLPKWTGWVLLTLILVLVGLAAYKGWQIYRLVHDLRTDVSALQDLAKQKIDISSLQQVGPLVVKLRADVGSLHSETAVPLRMIGPALGWVPTYGQDIKSAADLLDYADLMADAGLQSYQALEPALQASQNATGGVTPQKLSDNLAGAVPQLEAAQKSLASAATIRARLPVSMLSPQVQAMLQTVDPLANMLDQGLSMLITLPRMLGAAGQEPKAYLLVVQNEDEMRATGGYITSVGYFQIKDGKPFGLSFEDSEAFVDWSKPYPTAPWQWDEYMNIPVTLLRDANWSPNYPATATLISYLYTTARQRRLDGVIMVNQHVLITLLQILGPIKIDGVDFPINADNVIQFLRDAKKPPAPNDRPSDWYRKAYISKLANAMLEKILSGQGVAWDKLVSAALGLLNQRHILLQFDDPAVMNVIKARGWDGSVDPGSNDFLMVVNTNVGFNKANAVVDSKLTYDVDLTKLASPTSSLVAFDTNKAGINAPCKQYIPWNGVGGVDEWYGMNRCYWDYLRVYVPYGAALINSTPHAVSSAVTLSNKYIPARVDNLENIFEQINGVAGFGTLFVVPGDTTLETSFNFALPGSVVSSDPATNLRTYDLKIQKQSGSLATPISIRIHLPANAHIQSIEPAAAADNNNILLDTTLQTDVNVRVVFSAP